MNPFNHQKLNVYRAALEFVALADEVVQKLPHARRHLADQLQHGAISVPLSIVEAAGETSGAERVLFFRMAFRSTAECAALLEVCGQLKLAHDRLLSGGHDLLGRIASMLNELIRDAEGSTADLSSH